MHCRSLALSRLSYQSLYPSTLPLVPSFLSLSFFFLFSRFFSFWATFQYNNHKLRFITSNYQTQFKHWTICGLKAYINGGSKHLTLNFDSKCVWAKKLQKQNVTVWIPKWYVHCTLWLYNVICRWFKMIWVNLFMIKYHWYINLTKNAIKCLSSIPITLYLLLLHGC